MAGGGRDRGRCVRGLRRGRCPVRLGGALGPQTHPLWPSLGPGPGPGVRAVLTRGRGPGRGRRQAGGCWGRVRVSPPWGAGLQGVFSGTQRGERGSGLGLPGALGGQSHHEG